MTKFEISVVINQPIDTVIKAFLNPANITHWTTDLQRFEVIKGKANEVGSIARLHYFQKGRTYVMEDKLEYCEPGRKYVSQVSGEALIAHVEMMFHPAGNETEMNLIWSGRGKTFPLKLLLPLLRGKVIKQARAELETFKGLVETRGADFKKQSENSG